MCHSPCGTQAPSRNLLVVDILDGFDKVVVTRLRIESRSWHWPRSFCSRLPWGSFHVFG